MPSDWAKVTHSVAKQQEECGSAMLWKGVNRHHGVWKEPILGGPKLMQPEMVAIGAWLWGGTRMNLAASIKPHTQVQACRLARAAGHSTVALLSYTDQQLLPGKKRSIPSQRSASGPISQNSIPAEVVDERHTLHMVEIKWRPKGQPSTPPLPEGPAAEGLLSPKQPIGVDKWYVPCGGGCCLAAIEEQRAAGCVFLCPQRHHHAGLFPPSNGKAWRAPADLSLHCNWRLLAEPHACSPLDYS